MTKKTGTPAGKSESESKKTPIPWRKIIYYAVMGAFVLIIGFLIFATVAS